MAGGMSDARYAANRARLAELQRTRGGGAAAGRLSRALEGERRRRARTGESTAARPNRI